MCIINEQCNGTDNAGNCTNIENTTLCFCQDRYLEFQGRCIKGIIFLPSFLKLLLCHLYFACDATNIVLNVITFVRVQGYWHYLFLFIKVVLYFIR